MSPDRPGVKAHFLVEGLLAFQCPGCGCLHAVGVNGRKVSGSEWQWNQSLTAPTFSPSILIFKDTPAHRCHSFVTDGHIKFFDDCHHAFKGQTIELPDWDG